METFDEIKQILCEICDVDEDLITPSVNLVEELDIDSIDILDVVYEINKKFGIKVPIEQWLEEINANKAEMEDYFNIAKLVENIEAMRS